MPLQIEGIAAIVLAGGRSSRTGEAMGPKGLIEVEGAPFILRQVQALEAVGLVPLVVTGAHHPAYTQALAGQSVDLTRNPDPERGPFSSLQCGIAAHPTGALGRGIFVQPLDVPVPGAEVFEALLTRGLEGEAAAAIPTHGGRGGHPVWLSREIARALLSVPEGPEARLDRQLAAFSPVVRVEVEDAGVRLDLNTESAWRAYLALHRPDQE